MTAMSVTIPLRTLGPNGSHGHWATLARRRKAERTAAATLVRCRRATPPCTVRLIRGSAGVLDDDNLRGALKGVRDGVADALGVDDRDPRVTWQYAQERTRRGVAWVRVEITAGTEQ